MLYSILTAMGVILAMAILLALSLYMAEKHGKTTHCQGHDHCGAGGCAGCSMAFYCDEHSREDRSESDVPVSRIEGEHHYGTR